MTDIRKGLTDLADAIEKLQNTPSNKIEILDRELSGNKIHGGMITNFSSKGIEDKATTTVLEISDKGIAVPSIDTSKIVNNLTVHGDLNATGTISAQKLNVQEVSSDIRLTRSSPLVFEASKKESIANKGLLWSGNGPTKQFVFLPTPDRFFSSESIDLFNDRDYKIANKTVLSSNALGNGVIDSKLRTVGVLKDLKTTGNLNIDSFVFYDSASSRLGIGTDNPSANLSIQSFDHEFIISSEDNEQNWQVGSRSTIGMQLVTDSTPRITISKTGSIQVHSTANFNEVSINSTNNDPSVKFSVGGPIVHDGKKFIVSTAAPTNGSFSQGDIAWNASPQSKGYVGWICVKSGMPGDWKTFGPIS